MRLVLAILAACAGLAVAVAQDGGSTLPKKVVSTNYDDTAASGNTVSPKIVNPPAAEPAERDNAIEVPDYAAPAEGTAKKPTAGLDQHFETLESQLDLNQKNLEEITKQVAHSLHERKRLLLVGEEMHALMSLHKAAKMLHENQQEISAVEEEIKKLGEEAEELIRQRTELKKQLEEDIKEKDEQLEATRGKLGELSQQLDSLHQEHEHAARLVSAWQTRAKAIRSAREKHEEMDAMQHMMGGPMTSAAAAASSDPPAFPAGHEAADEVPDVSANAEDLAKLEASITAFANKHVNKAAAATQPAAAAQDAAAAAKPADQDGLMANQA